MTALTVFLICGVTLMLGGMFVALAIMVRLRARQQREECPGFSEVTLASIRR